MCVLFVQGYILYSDEIKCQHILCKETQYKCAFINLKMKNTLEFVFKTPSEEAFLDEKIRFTCGFSCKIFEK